MPEPEAEQQEPSGDEPKKMTPTKAKMMMQEFAERRFTEQLTSEGLPGLQKLVAELIGVVQYELRNIHGRIDLYEEEVSTYIRDESQPANKLKDLEKQIEDIKAKQQALVSASNKVMEASIKGFDALREDVKAMSERLDETKELADAEGDAIDSWAENEKKREKEWKRLIDELNDAFDEDVIQEFDALKEQNRKFEEQNRELEERIEVLESRNPEVIYKEKKHLPKKLDKLISPKPVPPSKSRDELISNLKKKMETMNKCSCGHWNSKNAYECKKCGKMFKPRPSNTPPIPKPVDKIIIPPVPKMKKICMECGEAIVDKDKCPTCGSSKLEPEIEKGDDQ